MPRSAIILAGGKGSRIDFTEKFLIEVEGKPLLSYVVEKVSHVVDEIIVSVRDEEQGGIIEKMYDVSIAIDPVKDFGPLAGMMAGLEICSFPCAIVLACDMPCVNKDVINLLFDLSEGFDAVVPRWENGFIEPLHAVYRRDIMLCAVRDAILRGKKRLFYAISTLPEVRYVPMDRIREVDPSLRSFININKREDLQAEIFKWGVSIR
ncbi:MAG: molybdenum cofactor guanylyltransferase [Candidatus Syntropharchaeia archaeon]